MSRFADVLRQTSERLDLPQPARSRILLEVAADMDDLFDHHRAEGLDEDAAHDRVVQNFDLSDTTLALLAEVHCGPVRRRLDRLSTRRVRIWERVLLVLLFVATMQTGGWLTRSERIVGDAGPWAWPVFATAACALVVALAKTYQFALKQDHHVRRLRRGLNALLRLSVGLAFLGFTGSWFEAVRAVTGDSPPEAVAMMQWALQSTALLQLSLGLALPCAAAWFGLSARAARIEAHEAESLLIAR